MSPLEKIPGIHSELAALLGELGVHDINDLAQADAGKLHNELELLGRKRGRISLVPGIIGVRLFIKLAQEKLSEPQPELDLDEIPEAEVDRSHEDIPEAIIEEEPVKVPKAQEAPRVSSVSQVAQGPQLSPRRPAAAFGGGPPIREDQSWKGLDQSRFQTLDAYAEGGRGIQPLKRTQNSREMAPAKLSNTKGQALPRTTRRGVVHPSPYKLILGSIVAILWRLSLLASCLALPYFSFVKGDEETRPIGETLIWIGALVVLGFLHLWFIANSRCRVCSCHLFYSKRCFKNSKAHLVFGLGYVMSLAVHLLTFQWFRCMYCGTAIRLFPAKVRATSEEEDAEES